MSEQVVDRYQAALAALADDAERRCLALLAAYDAGQITYDDLVQWLAVEVGRANAAAYGFADAAVASQVELAVGAPTSTTGIYAPDEDADRLVQAVTTLLADQALDTSMQVARLARAEPFSAGQHASVAAMREHKLVQGWVRQMDGDPCQLCQWWSRNGRVWPKAHPFQRHPGCNCQPRVVARERIQSTEHTRRLSNA